MNDAFWIGLAVLLILLTFGLIRLCDPTEPRRWARCTRSRSSWRSSSWSISWSRSSGPRSS